MDTREKIVPLPEIGSLLPHGDWVAVAGDFDPLTLTQAERLASFADGARKLLAVVSPGDEESLLPATARAALVAALRSVDAVVIASPDAVRACGVLVHEDSAAERRRSAEFVHFVLQR